MKYLIGILGFLVFALFSLIAKADPPKSINLHIDFQEGFQNTPVKLWVDEHVSFDKTISTNQVIGRADGVVIIVFKSIALLTVKCGQIEYTHIVNLDDSKYIGLSIKGNQIILSQSNASFTYE